MLLTLPKLFWIIYYIIIFLTLITGIINWVRQRYTALSAITIIFSLLVPIVSFVYTVGRTEGMNELEYVIAQFKTRDPWTLFIIGGYLYLVAWWFFFVRSLNFDSLSYQLKKILVLMKDWLNHISALNDKRKKENGDKERKKQ